jgi:predicted ester cyclase
VIDILQLADGKITDHWVVVDQLGLMQQIGVIPAPGQAS